MRKIVVAAALTCGLAAPAQAEVTQTAHGFAVTNEAVVPAQPDQVWAALIEPSRYWDGEHSWSGDAANFSLDPVAGGCFCEIWSEGNSAEHLRVVLVRPNEQLVLRGALGPLVTQGMSGALTWHLEPVPHGTRIRQSFIVGGHLAAFDIPTIAPAVDGVLNEQLTRLAALFSEPAE